MDWANLFFKYRKAIIIAVINIVGLIIILGGVWLVKIAAVGPIPDPETAPPQKVVQFLSDDKISILPSSTKRRYLRKTIQYYSSSPARRRQFTQAISKLPDYRLKQLKENLFGAAKDQVVEYAKEYSQLESYEQRCAYIDRRLGELRSLEAVVKGKPHHSSDSISIGADKGKQRSTGGKSAGPDLTKDPRLAKGVPTSPGGIYKKFIEKTKPADRARLETFVNDVQARIQQLKKMKKF